MQIHLENKLDVELVERKLAELWGETTDSLESYDDRAVLRARVANLVVFVGDDALVNELASMIPDLTKVHPSRVLVLVGEKAATDKDLEIFVTSLCQTDKSTGAKRLCGEEITIKAQGKFVIELPSAAIPLLVSDLSTFVWWRDALESSNEVLSSLLSNTDRLIVDSADFRDPSRDLIELYRLLEDENLKEVGVSDLNWARLTLWRGLLADFYDVHEYGPWLEEIDSVRIDYVAPEFNATAVAPQAMLITGWLASRLGWTAGDQKPAQPNNEQLLFNFTSRHSNPIVVELNQVERGERKSGRLVKVEIRSKRKEPAAFVVSRSDDNRHIVAEVRLGSEVRRGRVLPVRNRTAAQLLGREMEILVNDNVYQESVAVAVGLIRQEG